MNICKANFLFWQIFKFLTRIGRVLRQLPVVSCCKNVDWIKTFLEFAFSYKCSLIGHANSFKFWQKSVFDVSNIYLPLIQHVSFFSGYYVGYNTLSTNLNRNKDETNQKEEEARTRCRVRLNVCECLRMLTNIWSTSTALLKCMDGAETYVGRSVVKITKIICCCTKMTSYKKGGVYVNVAITPPL